MPKGIYKRKPRGHMSEEHRKSISLGKMGKSPSLEARLKMSKSKIGTKLSEKTKKKMSEAHRKTGAPWNLGRKFTEEHKKKISLSNLGKVFTEESKEKMRRNNPKNMQGRKGALHPKWKGGYENKLWHNRQRRTMKLNAKGSHTQTEWEALKMRWGYMCLCCKKEEPEITLSEDHIIPLSKQGTDYIDNIQPLCRSCNSRKHNSIINYKENLCLK